MDSATYFFAEAHRIAASNYLSSMEDVLRARAKTTAITETRFPLGQLSIHMVDVGGQRVTSIVFCTALLEYDQVLLEERNQNRMAESLVLFESVINSRWFLRTSIIHFLTKINVFKNKLPKVPLDYPFPEYTRQPGSTRAPCVTSIIFCTALSERDQVLLEERNQIGVFKNKLPKARFPLTFLCFSR
ncbi:G-protein alpha subunit-domain-containing protein [Lactarius hengduanensis]|nr:G-protein alpha subunit-domain-containing protein [Lactarius hengduanensis]